MNFETYYTNIRSKKKLISQFKERAEALGKCEDSALLIEHCGTLQKEIDELMELFRGKVSAKSKQVVYVPMDIIHALDYLSWLILEDAEKNIHTIRNLMNALEFNTGVTKEDGNQLSHYRKLIRFFTKKGKGNEI